MAKKTTMLTPVIKAYNDWCEQWEKGLGEAEKFQKQMLETPTVLSRSCLQRKRP
jgi:hypothetical protein